MVSEIGYVAPSTEGTSEKRIPMTPAERQAFIAVGGRRTWEGIKLRSCKYIRIPGTEAGTAALRLLLFKKFGSSRSTRKRVSTHPKMGGPTIRTQSWQLRKYVYCASMFSGPVF